jgi:hypothetical protein
VLVCHTIFGKRQALLLFSSAANILTYHPPLSPSLPIPTRIQAVDKSLAGTKGESIIDDLYGGTAATRTKCQACKNQTERVEIFNDVNVNVIHESGVGVNDLVASLELYTKAEAMSGDNMYHCEPCGKKCNATRQTMLHKVPPILTFGRVNHTLILYHTLTFEHLLTLGSIVEHLLTLDSIVEHLLTLGSIVEHLLTLGSIVEHLLTLGSIVQHLLTLGSIAPNTAI